MPGEGRGEGSGNRRRRGGRGRDRGPREGVSAEGEASEGSSREASSEQPAARQDGESAEPLRMHAISQAEPEFELVPPAPAPASMPLFENRDEEPRARSTRMSQVAEPQAFAPEIAEPQAFAPRAAEPQAPAEPIAVAADYVLPIDSLVAVADNAGLQWVNSDVEKIRAAQAAMAAMPVPIHVPREIRKAEVADDGPLVLVETKKDLSQVRLPFETQAPGG